MCLAQGLRAHELARPASWSDGFWSEGNPQRTSRYQRNALARARAFWIEDRRLPEHCFGNPPFTREHDCAKSFENLGSS